MALVLLCFRRWDCCDLGVKKVPPGLRRRGDQGSDPDQEREGRRVGRTLGPLGPRMERCPQCAHLLWYWKVKVTRGQCPQSPKKQGLDMGCTSSPTTTHGDAQAFQ